jgi:UDP-N-acetylmuramoyl-tripeptide--D-alanyl-D-alanine ligase
MSGVVKITLNDIFNIKGTHIFNPDNFKDIYSIKIDSRKVERGDFFIALKGERFDGHDFVNEAIKSGASSMAIERKHYKRFNKLEIPFVVVNDTTKFLGQIASIWRSKLKTKIIGIGGSNGKTTTKEILATLLSHRYSVNKTEANNNNHIGVPLTILSTNNNHKFLVLEFGSNHPGEIKYIAEIARPDYALITNIGDSHLEFFGDRIGVLKEESELFRQTLKNNGKIFLNYEDELLRKRYSSIKNKITYSSNYKTDFIESIEDVLDDGRIKFIINNQKKYVFTSPIPGEAGSYNFFAAIVVAKSLGMTYPEILKAQKKVKPFDKRLEIKKYNSTWIINDCYNANPSSMILSLSLLNWIKHSFRKVAILGDMFELGDKSIEKHKEVGDEINSLSIDFVLTIGNHSKAITNAINKTTNKKHFHSKAALRKYLDKMDLRETVILVKGSRGMKLEEITEYLEGRLK